MGNILRLIFAVVQSPFKLLRSRDIPDPIENYIQPSWLLDFATTPDAVLANARGGGSGQYEVTGLQPTWVLEVTIQNGTLESFRQIPFSEEVKELGYTALSYPMRSAYVLATEDGFVPAPSPTPNREFIFADRRAISEYFLRLYCSAGTRLEGNPSRTEFIWLDEWCLSDCGAEDDEAITTTQRSVELGRLTDIFRRASQVTVFCHEEDCDHTTLECIWGKRLFTLPEILHAETVWRLTRRRQENTMSAQVVKTTGREFREAIQTNAAKGNRWHL